jgi:hypothetical protein
MSQQNDRVALIRAGGPGSVTQKSGSVRQVNALDYCFSFVDIYG